MKYLKLKDFKNRKNFLIHEKTNYLNKFIFVYLMHRFKNSKVFGKFLSVFLTDSKKRKLKFYSKVRLSRRCLLSNRNRAVLRSYGLSRIVFRDFAQLGILPGYKKAV